MLRNVNSSREDNAEPRRRLLLLLLLIRSFIQYLSSIHTMTEFLTSTHFKWCPPRFLRRDILNDQKRVESRLINVWHPQILGQRCATVFCILKPSEKKAGAISFLFRCSRTQTYLTAFLALGYEKNRSGGGGGEGTSATEEAAAAGELQYTKLTG